MAKQEPQDYAQALLEKGDRFMGNLNEAIIGQGKQPKPWGAGDIAKSGWREVEDKNTTFPKTLTAFVAAQKTGVEFFKYHKHLIDADTHDYDPESIYRTWYNVDAGIIIVHEAKAPMGPLKGVYHLSDFLAALHSDLCHGKNESLVKLSWIVRYDIDNYDTHNIAKYALDKAGVNLGPWPGHEFPAESEHFRRLLASRHGYAAAYLLTHYQHLYPGKTLSNVVVFAGTKAGCVSLAWEIK